MNKLHAIKKILSFVTCSALSLAFVAFYPSGSEKGTSASAKTIAEIQEERNANNAKIAEYESQISELEGSKEDEQEYQTILTEQIAVIQDNIDLLNSELEKISEDIETAETNIADLDQSIKDQQAEIDENVELFKQRLCAMYVNGNDNLATVVVGSADLYDMISRVEMVNRIASYDEQLITDILADIDELETSKKNLETEKQTLELKLEDQQAKKEEKADEMVTLYDKMQQTQDEIDRIAREQEMLEGSKEELAAANAALDAEEEEIQAAIKREQEAAQAAYEAEQKRLAQEAAAAQAAAEEAARLAAQTESANETVVETSTTAADTTTQAADIVIPAPSASGFIWPAPGFSYVSSGYGARWGTTHRGIDIGDAGIHGGAAVASKSGTVISVNNSCTHDYAKTSSCGCGGGYGNYVIISHDGTYSTLYGHLQSAAVSVGQYVEQGQVIGYIGSTGWSTGSHLHFEVRVNGVAYDPLSYVSR